MANRWQWRLFRDQSRSFVGLAFVTCLSSIDATSAVGQDSAVKQRRAATSPTADAAINALLQPIRDKHGMPGLIGGIVREDRLIAVGAVGIRKVGAPQAMTVSDLVHIGSNTKAMTAAWLGTLVESGKLRWDSTLGKTLAAQSAIIHADYRPVTLTQLLTHRAGLPANIDFHQLAGKTTTDKRRALMRDVLGHPPESKPGSKFEYSNVGYALAGLMGETVAGIAWENGMRADVFGKLAMASAGFGPPGARGKVDQPWGHLRQANRLVPFQKDNAAALGPAGTVHCSLADWARFVGLFLRPEGKEPRMLKAETLRTLQTPPRGGDYAFGWFVVDQPWSGGPALNHHGSNTMWHATVWAAPRRHFAVLIATNYGGDEAQTVCDEAAAALVQLYEERYANRGR